MSTNDAIFGYSVCVKCGEPVLDFVAYKTQSHCAECFRQHAAEILDPIMTVVAGREKIVLRTNISKRRPGVRAQRARARARDRKKPEVREHRRVVAGCADRASRKLRRLFPEIYELLLADERQRAGLNAYTIDMALTPGDASSSLEFARDYHALNQAS